MKKPALIFIILLLVSMVSMVTMIELNPVYASPTASTRLYLPSSGAAPVSPAFSGDWDKTSDADRLPCFTAKTLSKAPKTSSENSSDSPYDVLTRQYVSLPIQAQTISGTVKGQIRCKESSADADFCRAIVIKVVSNDGSTVRGTLLSHFPESLTSEYHTSLQNRNFPPSLTLTPVTAQEGDRIVIEIGTRAFNTLTTNYTATHSFGDYYDDDLPEDETTTSFPYSPWIEFSQTILSVPAKLSVEPSSTVDYTLLPETPNTIRPMADGTYTAWTGTYTDWDEATQNGDTDYVSATAEDLIESSQLQDITTPPTWTIARVRVVIYAKANETTDEKVLPILVVDGTAYPATIRPMEYIPTNTSYAKYTGDWGLNPDTDANWTWSDINLLQAGVQSAIGDDEVWTGEIRVTQLYVEVAGPRFTHRIMVANVTDLFSWQVKIHYNPTILEVTGVSLKNQVFGDHDYYAPVPFIDNTEGYALIFVGLLAADPLWTFSGTGPGILCHINYLVKDIGVTPLHFSPYGPSTFLANSSKQLIPASTADGFFGNTILGDVTSDAKVNIYDLFNLGKAYSSIPNTPNWNPKCDFNWDGKVNASDLSDQSKNYGKSIP